MGRASRQRISVRLPTATGAGPVDIEFRYGRQRISVRHSTATWAGPAVTEFR